MQRSRSEKFDKLLVLVPVIFSPIILFGQALFTGRVLYWGLPALQFIPWRFFAWENMQQGIIPLWNALNGMGAPLLANYQLALFYPPGWLVYLFAALGGIAWLAWAHTLLVVLHLIWAGLGMARLAKKIGLQPLAQSLCGLSFGLTGYFVARGGFFSMIWAGAWIPWIFLYVSDLGMPVREEPVDTRQKILHLPLVFVITLQLLAGHAQLSWYTLTLATMWVVIGKWVNAGFRQACSALARFALAAVLAAVISSIQLLPTFEYLQQSQRSAAVSYETAMTYSFWPWRLISLFAPDFFGNPGSGNYWGYASFWEDAAYIGLVPMLLALSTFTDLFLRKKKDQLRNKFQLLNIFLWCTAGLGFLLALGKNTPVFPFLYRFVPSFDMFQAPSRFMIWFVLAFCLLAGLGVEKWHTPTGKGLYWFRLSTAGMAAVTIGAILAGIFIKGDIHFSFIRAAAIAGIWGLGGGILSLSKTPVEKRGKQPIWEAVVVVWVALDLIVAGWNLNPSLPAAFYQAILTGKNPTNQPLNGQRLYLSPNDEYLLKFSRFFRFDDYSLIEDSSHLSQVILPDVNLIKGIASANNFDPLLPARYSVWMDKLSGLPANSIIPWLSLMNVGAVENREIDNSLGISFNPQAASNEFYWTNCALYTSGGEAALAALDKELSALPVGQPFREVVLEGDAQPAVPCSQAGDATIEQTLQVNSAMQVKVTATQNGWLVTSNAWYPGWIVLVDGQRVPLLRANYLFQAVWLLAGTHHVEFIYQPVFFYAGAGLSLLGIIGVLAQKYSMKLFPNKIKKATQI